MDTEVNKWYVCLYAIVLMLSAISSGYYVSFTSNWGFRYTLTDTNWTTPLIIVPGTIIGNAIVGFLPKVSKRKKIIFASFLIILSKILFCLIVYYSLTEDIYFYFSLFAVFIYGIGIAMNSVTVPLYLRDIIPKEGLDKSLVFYIIFFCSGSIFYFVIQIALWSLFKLEDIVTIFNVACSIPIILSLAQLIFLITVFRRDSPKDLCLASLQEDAMEELLNIYPSKERRISEFEQLGQMSVAFKFEYPTYSKLFSRTHIGSLLKASLAIFLKAPLILIGNKLLPLFSYAIHRDLISGYMVGTACQLTIILGSLFAFLFIDKPLNKRVQLFFSIILSLCVLGLTITSFELTFEDVHSYSNPTIIIMVLGVSAIFLYGLLIYVHFFIYAMKTVPERGFTLVMVLDWLGITIILAGYDICFYNFAENLSTLYACYGIFCFIASIISTVFLYCYIPKSFSAYTEPTKSSEKETSSFTD